MSQLQRLLSHELQEAAFPISTAEGLQAFLRSRPEVVGLRTALACGELTAPEVEEFVRELLRSFAAGRKFSDEIVLAAIAVAVETLPGRFSEEYLGALSTLRIKEMPLAPRVASLSRVQRAKRLVGLTERLDVLSVPLPEPGSRPTEFVPVRIDATNDENYRLAS